MENQNVETKQVETNVEKVDNTENQENKKSVKEVDVENVEQEDEDVNFTDSEEDEEETEENLDNSKTSKTKTEEEKRKERNSKFAQLRREKEAREKEIEEIKKQAYRQALIDAVDGVNPYTGDKIEDEHDIDEYLTMREMDKKGLDPVADYHKYLKEKAREEKNKTTFNNTKLTEEQIKEDAILFKKTYPNVSVSDLQKDTRFLKFSEGKLETQPLTKVYGDYLDFVKEFDAEVDKKARRLIAKAKSSPGNVETSQPTQDSEFYTFEEIQKMSQAEVSKNFEKVQRSLKKHYETMKK